MNAATVSALVIAALAVISAIGSVALLSFRVGRLVGVVEGHIRSSDEGIVSIWKSLGEMTAWTYRHLEIYHGAHRERT